MPRESTVKSGKVAVAAKTVAVKPATKAAAARTSVPKASGAAAIDAVASTARAPRKQPDAPAQFSSAVGAEALLAMSIDDYMNERQLKFFRDMLTDMKRQLLSNAGETSEHLRENDMVPDPADRATIEEEHAHELRTRDRERKLMKKIDQSLLRIDDGSYGYCEETGDPIGLQRLLARPTATLSVEAQQRRELKQKMFGE